MSKKTKEYTPSDKARHFTLGSLARVGACIYLIYVIYSLISEAVKGNAGMSMTAVIIITSLMAVIGGYLIFVTIKEVIRGVKNKEYSMHKYYSEELTEQGLKYNSKGELVPIDTPDDEDEEAEAEEEYEEEAEYDETAEDSDEEEFDGEEEYDEE